jgi:hypothetical protein
MKYIITESRLNDIIESYLNSELGNLKLVKKDEDTDWYTNASGNPIAGTDGTMQELPMILDCKILCYIIF